MILRTKIPDENSNEAYDCATSHLKAFAASSIEMDLLTDKCSHLALFLIWIISIQVTLAGKQIQKIYTHTSHPWVL